MSGDDRIYIVHFVGPILAAINYTIILYTIWNQIRYFKNMKVEILYTLNIWLDLAFIVGNFWMVVYFLKIEAAGEIGLTYQAGENVIHFRQSEVICIISIYLKGIGFLRLIDSIAPLLDTLFSILRDIRSFMFVLYLFVFCFGVCFFLLGQNQLNFDDSLTNEEKM